MDLKTIDCVSTESPWVNIPDELLELIINHLTLYDRCRSQLVCRTWYSTIHAIPPYNGLSYGLPCQVSIDEDGKACTLVDPFCNKTHIKCSNLQSQSYILCSKGEWLLVAGDQMSIFFFNPLTTTRINLPDRDGYQRRCVYAFSSPPTSTDCLVIGYYSCLGETTTFLCRRGQREWTRLEDIENEISFKEAYVNPTFYQGTFYCLGLDGALALFDSCKSVWSFIPIREGPEPIITEVWKTELFMAQFNEELFMVFTDQLANSVKIYKLDTLARQWKDADNIGDRSLFVGRGSSICSEANALIGNKIYFPRIKDGVYISYSCGERKFHPDGNFYGSRVCQLSFWVEPVWFKYSDEELKWSE